MWAGPHGLPLSSLKGSSHSQKFNSVQSPSSVEASLSQPSSMCSGLNDEGTHDLAQQRTLAVVSLWSNDRRPF